MRYAGGKTKLAKYICPVLNKLRKGRVYLEPFCGSCAILAGVRGGVRLASDNNESVVLMWKGLQDGSFWPPIMITDARYAELKNEKPSALRGYAGTQLSLSGRWFGGHQTFEHSQKQHDLGERARRSFRALLPKLVGVSFSCRNYNEWNPVNMLVYCDPPYSATDQGYSTKNFDHNAFWEWCRKLSAKNAVVVSETIAPPDFKSIWSFTRQQKSGPGGGVLSYAENLFVHESSTCR